MNLIADKTVTGKLPVCCLFILLLWLPMTLVMASESVEISFKHQGNTLAGTLMVPDTEASYPVILFVHGDGPTDRENYGALKPLWDAFLDAGFGVYSWDKAGVGQSTGNWLSQSMSDRADEVIAAGEALSNLKGFNIKAISIWGISQAGWVLPMAVARSDIFDWMIIVSGAINWVDQSNYLTEQRLRYEGASNLEIERALSWNKKELTLFDRKMTYDDYTRNMKSAPLCCNQEMSKERWAFVKKNISDDVTPFLNKVDIPTLGIFGQLDANVDIEKSKAVYRREIKPSLLTIKTFSDADHAIMPAKEKRPLGMGSPIRDIYLLLKIGFLGADAYAPGYVNFMVDWAKKQRSSMSIKP